MKKLLPVSKANILALLVLMVMGSCAACLAEPHPATISFEQEVCDDFAGWRLYFPVTFLPAFVYDRSMRCLPLQQVVGQQTVYGNAYE